MKIKTQTLVKVFGSQVGVARFFGIKRQAIEQWGEFIPVLRVYELKERRPDIADEINQGRYSDGA